MNESDKLLIKKLIAEELLKGIPKFVIRNTVDSFIESLKKHVKQHIFSTKTNSLARRQALSDANVLLDELEDEVNELVTEKIWQFIQRT